MYSSKFSCAIKVEFILNFLSLIGWKLKTSIMRQLNNNYQYEKEI